MIRAVIEPTFDAWRTTARNLLAQNIPPNETMWIDNAADAPLLDAVAEPVEKTPRANITVPPAFIALAKSVAPHRDPNRWALLYRVLWRITHGEHDLLNITVDDDVNELNLMDKAVRRDLHKMHAFVRFRKVVGEAGDEHYIAWHRPDHLIVPLAAPWFAKRFAILHWSILTPDLSAEWDTQTITYSPGVPASAAPAGDELEDLWRTYYASIFNPARVKVKAMKKEMPVRHWATMPEADLIDDLLREAPHRVETMMKKSKATSTREEADGTCVPKAASAREFVPTTLELPQLKSAAAHCKGCDLYCNATQVVFGEGPETAGVMFVGEQPGDKEDLAGKPFIGPAGQMLNQALDEVGIDRGEVYVTNAVKHFKFEPRGTRRIHAKPNAREMAACRPWLEAEIGAVRPKLIVCLGATAAQSLMGPQFRITRDRGQFYEDTRWAPAVIATNHPAAILRVPDAQGRDEAYAHFVHDLKLVEKQMKQISRADADASAQKLATAD